MAEIIPVIFGGGKGARDIARSFSETYGVGSLVFAESMSPETKYSRFVTPNLCPGLSSPYDAAAVARRVLEGRPGATVIMFADNEMDASFIGEACAGLLPPSCVCPYPKRNALPKIFEECRGAEVRFIITTYSDKTGRLRRVCACEPLLGTPDQRRHAAVILRPMPEAAARLRSALDAVSYRGFASFSLSDDMRVVSSSQYQGYDCRFMSASGVGIAELAVRDLVFGEKLPESVQTDELLWRCVPAKRLGRESAAAERARRLAALGAEFVEPARSALSCVPIRDRLPYLCEELRSLYCRAGAVTHSKA